ncbi:gamma-glutamylcyclotransferase [Alphaproteobacteria bacterium]|nr:gamma-glutamylcyclotransferase [Alphaproteobacteria bacterium]
MTIEFHDNETREGLRAEALKGHKGDLYVFGYGSLMWDPALEFTEVRRACAPEHERRFILVDDKGGRGSSEAPGVMAALDLGQGCDGLVFRIAADCVDRETEILFRREMIAPGYLARFIPVVVDGVQTVALSFLADHEQPHMQPDIDRDEQIRFAATGKGILGSSLEYLQSTVTQLENLGIKDEDASALLSAAMDFRQEEEAA